MSTTLKPISTNAIRAFRQSRGLTMQQLADACATSKSQIDKLEKGQRRLTTEWMVRLSKPLGCDPRDLLAGPFALSGTHTNAQSAADEMLPVMGTVRAGKKQTLQLTQTPIDKTPRPYFLAHTQDAYAFHMCENNMQPMYRPRQLLFINPHKAPMPETGIVILRTDGSLQIAEYLDRKKDGIEIREYAPRLRRTIIPFTEIAGIHAIVAATEPQ